MRNMHPLVVREALRSAAQGLASACNTSQRYASSTSLATRSLSTNHNELEMELHLRTCSDMAPSSSSSCTPASGGFLLPCLESGSGVSGRGDWFPVRSSSISRCILYIGLRPVACAALEVCASKSGYAGDDGGRPQAETLQWQKMCDHKRTTIHPNREGLPHVVVWGARNAGPSLEPRVADSSSCVLLTSRPLWRHDRSRCPSSLCCRNSGRRRRLLRRCVWHVWDCFQ